ncbi:MAG: replication-associated recombination protein A [Fibrobacteria bacterium]|nr:replication-associated recombination protein A [Fibrobacteria bacterium]
MRPTGFDSLLGSPSLFGTDSPLRRAVEQDALGSAILWGPPGSGKTTVAGILRTNTKRPFRTLSAVSSGLPELRALLDEASKRKRAGLPAPRLFVDEIHRWNKAQQDALLPMVESGQVLLLGATTENPSYALNPALLSRCQSFRLEPPSAEEVRTLLRSALDAPQGLAARNLGASDEALDEVARCCDGDLRASLNLLEWAAATLPDGGDLTPQVVARAAGTRPRAYDRDGDGRYQQISALHKSVRGSDPQAGLYWLARMLQDGEDPLYIARRLVRMASEDVGLADPQALVQALAAKDACELLGMPECSLALAQATVFLCLSPKSNSLEVAWMAATQAIERHGRLPVPNAFVNAVTRFDRRLGTGQGYKYDHDSPDGYSGQDHLPSSLQGAVFWNPVPRGFERELAKRLDWFEARRESRGDPSRDREPPAKSESGL